MTPLFEALRQPVTPAREWTVRFHLERQEILHEVKAPYQPHSIAYFCPTCGEVWGRVECPKSMWHVEAVPCRRHGPSGVSDWAKWPGSILHGPGLYSSQISCMWWAVALDLLPDALVQREFDLALTEAERRYGRAIEANLGGPEGTSPRPGGDGEVLRDRDPG